MADAYFYLSMNELIDEQVKSRVDFIDLDDEGIPVAVGQSIESDAVIMGCIVTRDELAKAGLTRDDVPLLTVI
ncbi:hypothetical protein [Enteractinococcus helveticum]|uniref:Uncharacterized protein n=1 Tax=Enteractinococcus helveticum TaxID=1837282 RepID=A0A1B7M3F4_9MICC|nr:hypothetical protein [Enteractinococcus helveticum]OAV63124.1 hypothetical protein A6F49_02935 [Enteractinococcus helveticum]